jgi:hypothetical protein
VPSVALISRSAHDDVLPSHLVSPRWQTFTGTHYDIFGWRNSAFAIPAASAVIQEYLKR